MLIHAGETVPVSLVIADGVTDRFPRVVVFDDVGAAVEDIDLDHVQDGLYLASWTVPSAGVFVLVYTVYDDAGHTEVSGMYGREAEAVVATARPLAVENGTVRAAVAVLTPTNAIIVNAWLEIGGAPVLTGVTTANATFYTSTGASLVVGATQPSPDANGIFRFSLALPAFADDENPTYVVATIVHDAQTYKGVQGITFARVLMPEN